MAMNVFVQSRVIDGDVMALAGQMPGGAEANGSGTNDTDGPGQLRASAGIRSL